MVGSHDFIPDAQDIIQEGNIIHKIGNSLYDGEGNIVAGLAIVPWAQFMTDSADPLVGVDPNKLCNYLISDRLVEPGGQRPIFQVDPLSTTPKKRHLLSRQIYFANLSDAPSAVDWPGLCIFAANIGINGCQMTSDGAHYRPNNGYVSLLNNLSTLTRAKGSSPDITTEWQPAPVRLYRDINNESVLQDGDYLQIASAWCEKTGTTDALNVQVRFGTGNAITDASVLTAAATSAASNTQRVIRYMEVTRKNNTTLRCRNGQSTTFINGPVALTAAADIPVPNMDSSSDSYFNLGIYVGGSSDTALGLREYEVRLVKGY